MSESPEEENEYEAARAARIRENQAMLAQLKAGYLLVLWQLSEPRCPVGAHLYLLTGQGDGTSTGG